MQGRQDQGNDPWGRPSSSSDPNLSPKFLSLSTSETGQYRILRNPDEGTSKHKAIRETISQRTSEMRAIPKRPPTMARIEIPPEVPRAPRPQRTHVPAQTLHKILLIIAGIIVVLGIFAGVIGYFLASGINNSTGPSATTTNFLEALADQDYTQVYKDLGPAVTIRLSPDQFIQQAKSQDQCHGIVKNYAEVANSAQNLNNGQTYTYDYTITRAKIAKPYVMQITLQRDPNDNSWKVSDYGTDLGPSQPTACHK